MDYTYTRRMSPSEAVLARAPFANTAPGSGHLVPLPASAILCQGALDRDSVYGGVTQ